MGSHATLNSLQTTPFLSTLDDVATSHGDSVESDSAELQNTQAPGQTSGLDVGIVLQVVQATLAAERAKNQAPLQFRLPRSSMFHELDRNINFAQCFGECAFWGRSLFASYIGEQFLGHRRTAFSG